MQVFGGEHGVGGVTPNLHGDQGDRILSAVEAIYAAALQPADWPTALQAIADVFGDRGAALDYNIGGAGHAVISSPGAQAAADDFNRGWWRQNIRFERTLERGLLATRDTITDRHLVSIEEVETHPFYAEYLASHGLRWFAGTVIASDPGVWIGPPCTGVRTSRRLMTTSLSC
jgi:hypothetical protein